MKRNLLISILLILVGIVLLDGLICTIPPFDMTITTIGTCAVRSELYFEKHGKIPPSLASLPERDGYANSIMDGYDRQLLFEVRADRMVFMSYGKDGLPGGTGKNADVEIHYLTHKQDGSLWIGEYYWIIDAERHVQYPVNH